MRRSRLAAARAGHVRKRGQPCGRQRNVGSPRGPHLMVSTSMVYGCTIDVFNTEDISAECAGRELVLCPAGSAMSQRAMINLNKDGARPFRLRFCFASRHVGAVATCIFASILQSKVPAYRSRAKNREFSMFSTNDGRGYGLAAFDLQGYSRSLAFIVAPEALGYVEYS